VYSIILSLYQKLRARHDAHVMSVMMLGLEEKRAKVPNEMPIASNSCTMFFNTAKADIEPDFFKALDAFKKASQMISDSIPHMQKLYDELK
jgi:hypothetical protein